MGFLQRELDRVANRLQSGPLPTEEYGQLYSVQQTLLWALEPDGCFKSPYDMIVPANDTLEVSEGCLAENGHSPFSDSRDCHVS